jgi:hypothetical protein
VESFQALGTRFLQMPLGEVVHVEVGATGEVPRLRIPEEARP